MQGRWGQYNFRFRTPFDLDNTTQHNTTQLNIIHFSFIIEQFCASDEPRPHDPSRNMNYALVRRYTESWRSYFVLCKASMGIIPSKTSADCTRQLVDYYEPSMPAAILFLVLFGLATLGHSYQMVRTRTWFMIPFVIGGICESMYSPQE